MSMEVAGRAVRWLRMLQHPSGTWSDFHVAVGPSDTWVTAYVGSALANAAGSPRLPPQVRSEAAAGADAAAAWLLAHTGREGGWGYRENVRPDADSTSWVIRLLAARGRPAPPAAVVFLDRHASDNGYRTYHSRSMTRRWSKPTPDVTAVALLARFEAGVLDLPALRDGWIRLLAPARTAAGTWTSAWWEEPGYATAVAVEAWVAAGWPGPRLTPTPDGAPLTAFGQALWAYVHALTGQYADTTVLLAAERPGGGWPGDARLLVPHPRGGGIQERSIDARGVFTTATALRALLAAPPDEPAQRRYRPRQPSRDPAGHGYDQLIAEMSADLGVDPARSVAVFQALSAESLAWPAPWPSVQLSSLAAGLPLELSASDSRPGLRYTVEVGAPTLPPHPRALSAIGAIGRAAALLGHAEVWHRLQPAVGHLVGPHVPAPEGSRFWVWAGVDTASGEARSVLKIYLSAQSRDVPGGRDRVVGALRALGVPPGAPILAAVDQLEQIGYCHELGIGIAPGGRVGAKVYYDMRGWHRDVVAAILAANRLPAAPDLLVPEIPRVVLEKYAMRRAGIALRVGLPAGTVDELTVCGAFPPPMIDHDEAAARLGSWLASMGRDRGTYDRVYARIRPGWPARGGMLHGMFTRSLSARGTSNTIYLRPAYPR